MNDKIYSILGLAQKAGMLVSGNDTCEMTIKSGKCYLAIVTEDASDRTKKHFNDMCQFRDVKLLVYGSKEVMGKSIGKGERSIVAIKNEGFAKKIEQLITDKNSESGGVPIAKKST